MAKVFHHLNRIVSSRYLSEKDIVLYLDTLSHLSKLGFKCKPEILVFRSASSVKRSFDVLLDTGINPDKLSPALEDYTLYYYTLYSKKYYHSISAIDSSDLFQNIDSSDYAETLFKRIADFIIENIDKSVELRGVNKR